MRARASPVDALLALPHLKTLAEQHAAWRRAVTGLGHQLRVTSPPPLDTVDPEELARAAEFALDHGLCDDLDWIEPDAAAVALYELTSALPPGKVRRELGRRVFARLYEGRADTFAAVATRMVLGSRRPLETVAIRARLLLVFDLPVGSAVNVDPLALTLVTRHRLCERWLVDPSTGALPARRMAARLLELAAREAMTMAFQGDHYPRQVLLGDKVRPILERLLADREPLVWRHAAVARGLLATVDDKLEAEIEAALDPGLTPTSWRRAAVSLVGMLVGDTEAGLCRCQGLMESEIVQRDPGLLGTMVWGLPRVVESEPEAAEDLLERLCRRRCPEVVEATIELLADLSSSSFGTRAVSTLREVLATRGTEDSPALAAVGELALRRLELGFSDQSTLIGSVRLALDAFETKGAREAFERGLLAVQLAQRQVDQLSRFDPRDPAGELDLILRLIDLDAAVLERSRLVNLLLLGRRPADSDTSVPEMERLYDGLGAWLLDQEAEPDDPSEEWSQLRAIGRRRRLKTLLHLVDLDTGIDTDSDEAGTRIKARARRTLKLLLDRLGSGPDSSVHRVLCATVARSLDAAVREGVAEPSDALLLVADFLSDPESVGAIGEASTNPEVRGPVTAYDRFLTGGGVETTDEEITGTQSHLVPNEMPTARSVTELSQSLGTGGSYRGEALRQALLKLGRALEAIAPARGLSELAYSSSSGADPLKELETATESLRQLVASARRRVLGDESIQSGSAEAQGASLSLLVERAANGLSVGAEEFRTATSSLVAGLPHGIGSAVAAVLRRLERLPAAPTTDQYVIPLEKRRAALPDWLLPRRTIGAYYVVRALGSGGVSSVFVARRIEERNDRHAEHFALKVPQYDPTTARRLSEQEFLELFRQEAGALLSLPQHPNLARFVTFDLAARPKPILVMELIRGVSLDRLIRNRSLNTPLAFDYLQGVLCGLEAMHGVGVGHLDLKPSNVILRNQQTPVLVDFGLSGRKLRPGCGTLEYCAPEILGVLPPGLAPSPAAADIYAFACTAFEVLTGELLFDAQDETTLMGQHVAHDGWPDRLARLASNPVLRDLCVVLAACLRRDPRDRPDATATRKALSALRPRVEHLPWPFRLRRTVL